MGEECRLNSYLELSRHFGIIDDFELDDSTVGGLQGGRGFLAEDDFDEVAGMRGLGSFDG